MKKKPNQDLIKKPTQERLALQRRDILNQPAEKAVAAILEHPYPVTLVQSFAEEDLYLLVHTIGPDDALPVLSLASNQQWEYVLDMELWSRDRLDPAAMTRWYDRLLKADPDRFTHWISQERFEELEYYLYRNVEVAVREHDQDSSDLGDDYFSEDQFYYVRLRKLPDDMRPLQEIRDPMLAGLLKRIAVYDYARYQEFLLHTGNIIPAEVEEEFYRLRNLRLAEKGILPHHEAVGIYQPLSVADLIKRGRKPRDTGGRSMDALPLPRDPDQPSETANLFIRTLGQIRDEISLQRLQSEFAGLCNQVIAADQARIRDRDLLKQVVAKTGGYISIGMEKIAAETGPAEPYQAANLIQHHLLGDLFRVGYGCALDLKWRAEKWRRSSWFVRSGLPLGFWGEAGLGLLGGLMLKKPLVFDNYTSGRLYREFATLAEIRTTGRHLDDITTLDDLLACMHITIPPEAPKTVLTYKNLLLTFWVNHFLQMEAHSFPTPLALEHFQEFFKALWQSETPPRRVSDAMRSVFLDWLSERSAWDPATLRERLGSALASLFQDLESELGNIARGDLDPRFIQLFLFRRS